MSDERRPKRREAARWRDGEPIPLTYVEFEVLRTLATHRGRVYSRRILLITAHCEGINGWAECVAAEDPFYSSEWIESAWPTITHHLAPALIGRTLAQHPAVLACAPICIPSRN